MARLQDFPSVTPTSSDKILIIQSQGQGLAPHTIKLDSSNPTGTGSLSLNRKANTTTGENSFAVGTQVEASGATAVATGNTTTASGNMASANGYGTVANHRSQFVFGEWNTADASTAASTAKGNYIEVVGKGTSNANRSNARTLDWSGNEVLAGGLKINGNQDVATLLNLSSEYKVASTRADLMAWFVTKSGTMADGGIAIVTVNPNYSSDGFLGGSGVQPAIIFRNSSTVIRVAFPIICGQAYYYSNDWHYSKATMTNVTPT